MVNRGPAIFLFLLRLSIVLLICINLVVCLQLGSHKSIFLLKRSPLLRLLMSLARDHLRGGLVVSVEASHVLIVTIYLTIGFIHPIMQICLFNLMLTMVAAFHAFLVLIVCNQQVEFVSRRLIVLIHSTVLAIIWLHFIS